MTDIDTVTYAANIICSVFEVSKFCPNLLVRWEAKEELCLAGVDAAIQKAGAEHAAAYFVGAVDLRRDALLSVQKRDFGGLKRGNSI